MNVTKLNKSLVNRSMKYPVILYPAEEGGFVAEIISLPGCLARGETYQECLEEL